MAALICQRKSKRTVVVNTFHMKTIPSKNQSSKNASGRITISIMIQFMKQCFHFLLLPLLKAGHHFFISKSTQNWRRTAPGSIRSLKVNLRIARWKNPIHGRIFTLNAASTFSPMTVDIQCKDHIHSLRDQGVFVFSRNRSIWWFLININVLMTNWYVSALFEKKSDGDVAAKRGAKSPIDNRIRQFNRKYIFSRIYDTFFYIYSRLTAICVI